MKLTALIVGILALLGLIGGGASLAFLKMSGPPRSEFRTATVERGSLQATVTATGTIEPEDVIDVGAQVAGQIRSFGPDLDDSGKSIDFRSRVDVNTPLAQLDDSLYAAQVDQAKANVQRAEADMTQLKARLNQAEREWTRARKLGPNKGVLSEVEYDTAEANFETAKSALAVGEASIAQAKAGLKQAEVNLGYCTIRSPVKGEIVDRRVNIGQTVVAGLNAPSLFLIAKDLKRLEVWASVNEADIGSIHQGQRVCFTVDAHPGEVFQGEVKQIRLNAQMTQNVVTYPVVVRTDNSDGRLLPYETANLRFEVGTRENVLIVPNAALRWRPLAHQIDPQFRDAPRQSGGVKVLGKPADKDRINQGTIWVRSDKFVKPIKVRTGLSDGTATEITSEDLQEGSEIIVGTASTASSNGSDLNNPLAAPMYQKKNKTQ